MVSKVVHSQQSIVNSRQFTVFCILFSVSCFLCSVCCILFPVSVHAAVPQTINFQGYLTDPNGTPMGGTLNLTFQIFDAVSGGTSKWGPETHSVTFDNGTFNVLLGSFTYVTPIGYDVFDGTDRWVQITVGSDVLSPRQKMGSTAYTFYANLSSTAAFAANATNATNATYAYNVVNATGNFTVGGDIVVTGTVDGVNISTIVFSGGGSQSLSSTNTWTGGNYFTGNVGIGLVSPNEPLEIAGTGRAFFGNGGGASRTGVLIDGVETSYGGRIQAWNYAAPAALNLALQPLGGFVSIGQQTTTIDTLLDMRSSNAFGCADFDRTSNGPFAYFSINNSPVGTISTSDGATVVYGAFTGSHYAWTDEKIERGMLVSLTGQNKYLNENPQSEIIYGITISSAANDPAVLGAYLVHQQPDEKMKDDLHLVMAVGNGDMWVAGRGADINVGDYLISSDIPGHAMRDSDILYMVSYVVARAVEPVKWNEVKDTVNGVKHKKISVTFEYFVRNKTAQLSTEIKTLQEEIKTLKNEIEQLKKK